MRLATIVGIPSTAANESDVEVDVSITDVRETGEPHRLHRRAEQVTTVRITDRDNGAGNESATVQDTPLAVTVPCTATPDADPGLELLDLDHHGRGRARGGAGGQALDLGARSRFRPSTAARTASRDDGRNTLFALQGLFVP